MDKNLARVEMIKKIDEFLEIFEDRNWYVGDETTGLMAEAALSVLFSVQDIQDYLRSEDMLK